MDNKNIQMNFVDVLNEEEMFEYFCKDNSLIIEGIAIDEESKNQLLDFFKEAIIKPVVEAYVIKGYQMNKYYKLTGKNSYHKDLNIIVIKLDNFDMNKLMQLRMKYFGLFRWFNDVVDNLVA